MSHTITTLDVEASGIHPDSYPIEIGILLSNGDSYCSLIRPPEYWQYWSDEAQQIHGITRQELAEHGRPLQEVAIALNHHLQGGTAYSDCWVLDSPWVATLFEAANVPAAFSLSDIMYRLSEQEYDDLLSVKKNIEKELNIERHRATNDARVLQLAYERIIAQRA